MNMLRRKMSCGVVAAAVMIASLAGHGLATPPVFKDVGFDAAMKESVDSKKVFVFDAMTSWCGPCKVMDKTAWVDADVVSWINANAVAVQLDMDKHTELKERLRINAYPTIVVFRDGKEFDRIVGMRSGPELLAWLKGVSKGESKLDQTMVVLREERAKASSDATSVDFRHRVAIAEDLYEYGNYEEAARECEWLWETMPRGDAAMTDLRSGRLASLMEQVGRRHAPARAKFLEYRDSVGESVRAGNASAEQLGEWLTLNSVVNDSASTVAWAVQMSDSAENVAALQRVGPRVFPLLVADGQWKAAGLSLKDPVLAVDERGSQLGAYDVRVTPKQPSGTVPAIPLMRKSGAAAAEPAKSVPAIPLTRKGEPEAGAEPKMMPAIPLVRKGEAEKSEPEAKTVPAIPLTRQGEPPAKTEQPKAVPAMPLMRTPGGGGASKAGTPMPAIPEMGAPGDLERDDPASVAREVRYRLTLEFRTMAAEYYAACLAAGRTDEAAKISELTFKYSDTPGARLALAQTAARAGRSLPEHRVWMDEIIAAGEAAAATKRALEGAN